MLWPRFAAVLSFSTICMISPFIRATVVLQMDDGSVLEFPESLFHDIAFIKKSKRYTILTGKDKNHRVLAGFVARNPTPPHFRVEEELKTVLKIETLEKPTGERNRSARPQPFRIVGEGQLEDQWVIFQSKFHINGVAVFFLTGPEHELIQLVPEFQQMVKDYRPRATSLEDPNQVEAWMIIAAIVIICFNVGLVWFGIKQIAVFKRMD